VPGQEQNRILEERVAGGFDGLEDGVDRNGRMLLHEAQEVHLCRGVVIPIAAGVLEAGNLERAAERLRVNSRCGAQQSQTGA
jgi:hypothetical protein